MNITGSFCNSFFHVFKTMRKDLQASLEVHSTRAPRGEDPCMEGHRDVAKPRRLRLGDIYGYQLLWVSQACRCLQEARTSTWNPISEIGH